MLDRDKLQKILRTLDSVDLIDLSNLMGMGVDDLLIAIRDEILPEFTAMYKKNTYKLPFFNDEQTKTFFTSQIVDIGFLCQHIIKDIKETLKKKHNTFGHQAFYNTWLLNRGY